MGTNQSSTGIQFSVSKNSAFAREYVDISYKRKKADDSNDINVEEFPPNSTFLEIIAASGEVLHLEELRAPSKTIKFRLPLKERSLVARIFEKTPEAGDSKKIICSEQITVKLPLIISPEPVYQSGVRLSLKGGESSAFSDCTQVIQIARDGGVQSHDYLEFHNNKHRVNWFWCEGKSEIDFGICASLQDELITIKYYEKGTTFTSGNLVTQMKYTLRNPVEDMRVSTTAVEIEDVVKVSYQMAKIPHNCMIVGRCHGVRLYRHTITAMEGECSIRMPRLPGDFEIACIATLQGENQLAIQAVKVADTHNRSKVMLHFRGYAVDHKIITVRPQQRFDVQCQGAVVNAYDVMLLIEAKRDITDAPSHASLKFAIQEKPVGEQGICSFQMEKEGMYHVCLGLVHDQATLLGDWCTVIVSERVGRTTHPIPTEPLSTVPRIPLPIPSTNSADTPPPPPSTGFICAICLDKTVCMKFDPCKHVCTCESCCELLASRGIHACPICKKEVKSFEKVFLA